jgi:purine nucleoside permease
MNFTIANQQKKLCKKIKKLVTKLEDNIKVEETRVELVIEAAERPPAGIMRPRPNSAHHYWVGGLRTNGWIRSHNH